MADNNDLNNSSEVKNSEYEYLKAMDTQQLNLILQQESFLSNDEDFDAELIGSIMDILIEREPEFSGIDVSEALAEFKRDILPNIEQEYPMKNERISPGGHEMTLKIRHKTSRKFITLVAAAMLILIIGSSLIAYANGFDVLGYIIDWGRDTFQIGTQTINPQESYAFNDYEKTTYSSLEEAADAIDLPIQIPGWIPDGYEYEQTEVTRSSTQIIISTKYNSNTNTIVYRVIVPLDGNSNMTFEKDDDSVDIYEYNGTKYYMVNNLKKNTATWYIENTVYSLSGEISKDKLIKLIENLYERDV